VVGTALSILVDPCTGGVGGAVAARVFRRVGAEIERVILGPRQQRRVAQAAEAAAERMRKKGGVVRSDGFFDEDSEGESDGIELLEGVLRSAADSWERQKVPYIGRIFGTAAVDDSITPIEASHLVRVLERLSYRQIVLLRFWQAARTTRPDFVQRMRDAIMAAGATPADAVIIQELSDLAATRVLERDPDLKTTGPSIQHVPAFRTIGESIGVDSIKLTPLGEKLHHLMGLEDVPLKEVEAIPDAFVRGE
jgi:hypothetical protein